ncbi:hypothetical protein CH063_07238 [Colletotrichum higginsianum]|uniref:Uncharacterized protein n=1 Tax=Colletotrichum higginsianum (strain IMI 349063) TaxID=759273 RepID=H1V5F0_COLHI|nr:hypothetical protein CH063_07238 [Colletotrichum higginsianum]
MLDCHYDCRKRKFQPWRKICGHAVSSDSSYSRSGISQGLAMVRRRETLRVSSANRALYLPVREIKSKPAFVFRGGGNSTAPLGEK